MKKEYDVLIAGGGLAGLFSAALLARKGYNCCIVESQSAPGGRARPDERQGFLFDYGIHGLRNGAQGNISMLLARLGIPVRAEPFGPTRLFLDGKMQHFPEGIGGMLSTPILSLQSKIKMIRSLANISLSRISPEMYGTSVADWLEDNKTAEPDIQELFHIVCGAGLVCPDIRIASFGEMIYFIRRSLRTRHHGAYPIGGWQQIVGRLANMVRARGELRLDEHVESVLYEGDRAAGLITSQGEFRARCVVLTTPPKEIEAIAGPDAFEESVLKRIVSIIPTSGITCDFALSRSVSSITGTVFTSEPLTMGLFTSNLDPSVAPKGKQLGSWFYPLPYDQITDKPTVQREKMRLKNLISDMFPDVWNRLEFERTMVLRIVDGAIPSVGQSHNDRPGVRCAKIPNLFCAGDWVGVDGFGGDITANAASACADAVDGWLKNPS